jgi:hypothetical protein
LIVRRAGIATHFVPKENLPALEEQLLQTPYDEIEKLLKPYTTVSSK